MRLWWAVAACAVAIFGCSEPPVLAETRDIDLAGWESAESAVFHWDIQDTLRRHDVLLDIRHSQTYPYSNLYVFLTYRFPNGKSRVDTVECTLADEHGRWRGSGFGDLVDQRFMLNEGVRFPVKGRYGLEVQHGMRQDPLPSVANVGLRLEAHQGASRP